MGLIHIYCGDGKGKTTAAMGLALRGAGNGMRVHIVQLMKGNPSGEITALGSMGGITVSRLSRNYGFTKNLSEADREEMTKEHDSMLEAAFMNMGGYDMLIIDEFCGAYEKGLADRELMEKIVREKSDNTELVLTGRNPHEKFILLADYVSVINAEKHPYEKGITARKGIEF